MLQLDHIKLMVCRCVDGRTVSKAFTQGYCSPRGRSTQKAYNKYLCLETDRKLIEGFKNSKGKVNGCHYFPCQQRHIVLAPREVQCRACACWNWPCTVKPTLSLQTELAGAGTEQVPQRAIQRHTSQPVLKKRLFYGYRIQDRAG